MLNFFSALISMLGITPIAVENPTQDGRTLTEQSPLVFPNGAHFQGAQRDVQSERASAVPSHELQDIFQ